MSRTDELDNPLSEYFEVVRNQTTDGGLDCHVVFQFYSGKQAQQRRECWTLSPEQAASDKHSDGKRDQAVQRLCARILRELEERDMYLSTKEGPAPHMLRSDDSALIGQAH